MSYEWKVVDMSRRLSGEAPFDGKKFKLRLKSGCVGTFNYSPPADGSELPFDDAYFALFTPLENKGPYSGPLRWRPLEDWEK